ncbi:MAG: type II toxin-antitoxin system RelE/ParE family toxin [Syntrophobacterales bacterium]|nr:type II toxin-antitoxin system RelE/ParE family toxin [Syntrophobacterales bacterium]
MNVYRSKAFTRLARREGLTDLEVCQAVAEMNAGLSDANLGAGLFKKRIAMPGQGKRGSWRALLGFQAGKKAFFLYLFPKNSRDNIEDNEMKALKRLTRYYLTLKPDEIKTALQCGELSEVNCNEKRT